MYYRRLCKTLRDVGTLIEDPIKLSDYFTNDCDYYVSLYKYTKDQYDLFKKQNSISGIEDVVTERLYWDFDNKDDLESARQDTVTLVMRLINLGIDESDIQMGFSGKKGFFVDICTNHLFNVDNFKSIIFNFADGLNFDKVVCNANRILRILHTKHQDSGLYKIPLTLNQLSRMHIDEILSMAKTNDENPECHYNWGTIELPQSILDLAQKSLPKSTKQPKTDKLGQEQPKIDIDWSLKPKHLSNCRWAIQNGHFTDGQRSNMLTVLAATYKNQGDDVEIAYRRLKGVTTLQAKVNDCERFYDEELYNNIICQVYSNTWRNGQYSCKEPGNVLYDFCQSLGSHKCNHEDNKDLQPTTILDINDTFRTYVKHIEKNTIYTGIPSIDANVFLSTGANVGIIGASGGGKTSVALNILRNTSMAGVKTVFASLDMSRNRMFEKVCYTVSGLSRQDLYEKFRRGEEGPILQQIKEQFGNVNFFNKSCPTVSDVREYIINCQESSGEKIKLVMLDYFERVTVDMDDETSATKRIAGELQDLVNDLDICLVTLVQPNKNALSGGIDSPIYDYTSIKGSSFIYQSFRIIMSLWRPFYNPKTFEKDKFMQMAILKNDLGETKEFVFNWDGKRGLITEIGDNEELFRQWEQEKKNEQLLNQKGSPLGGGFKGYKERFSIQKQPMVMPHKISS